MKPRVQLKVLQLQQPSGHSVCVVRASAASARVQQRRTSSSSSPLCPAASLNRFSWHPWYAKYLLRWDKTNEMKLTCFIWLHSSRSYLESWYRAVVPLKCCSVTHKCCGVKASKVPEQCQGSCKHNANSRLDPPHQWLRDSSVQKS